jgi:hypothetical protein
MFSCVLFETVPEDALIKTVPALIAVANPWVGALLLTVAMGSRHDH